MPKTKAIIIVSAINTAAGIDTVSITGLAFTEDPSLNLSQPPMLLLFGAGLLAFGLVRKTA